MNDSISKINRYIKNALTIITSIIKHSELVYPVHHKGGASVVHPNGPHNGQDQGKAGWKQAKDLIGKAHGLGRGQSRVSYLQNTVAGRQRLLEAAVLSDEVLIKINFSLLSKTNEQ